MSLADEIREAMQSVSLDSEQFTEVPREQARDLVRSFLERFTGGADVRWWWEHFRDPRTTWLPEDGRGFERLVEIVPDPDERIWFVGEDDQAEFYPVYEATAASAQQVIGNCYGFEYYLIAKDLSWLVCENHHDSLFAIGHEASRRLHALASDPS